MSDDISHILERWPWDPEHTVRQIISEHGRECVQIRVCLHSYHGILQFYCDGRPDGESPYGGQFALDHFQTFCLNHPEHKLTPEEAGELFEEAIMVYQRYVVLFQMGDFERVIRDTDRNMRLFRFVRDKATREEDRFHLDRWWPYILRIHYTARAMLHLTEEELAEAETVVQEALQLIENLEPMDDESFLEEYERSIQVLNDLLRQIHQQRPMSHVEVLEQIRDRAIGREDYELAAKLRDQIIEMRKQQYTNPPERDVSPEHTDEPPQGE